MANLVTTNLI